MRFLGGGEGGTAGVVGDEGEGEEVGEVSVGHFEGEDVGLLGVFVAIV